MTGCERLTIAFWMHCSYTICLFVCLFVFGGYYIYIIYTLYIYIYTKDVFVFQPGAVFLAICCILEPEFPICMPTWLLAFGLWLLAFGFCWLLLAFVGSCWLLLAFVGFWLWFHLAVGFTWLWLLLGFSIVVCI